MGLFGRLLLFCAVALSILDTIAIALQPVIYSGLCRYSDWGFRDIDLIRLALAEITWLSCWVALSFGRWLPVFGAMALNWCAYFLTSDINSAFYPHAGPGSGCDALIATFIHPRVAFLLLSLGLVVMPALFGFAIWKLLQQILQRETAANGRSVG